MKLNTSFTSKAHLYAFDHDSPRAGSVVPDDHDQVLPDYYIDILKWWTRSTHANQRSTHANQPWLCTRHVGRLEHYQSFHYAFIELITLRL